MLIERANDSIKASGLAFVGWQSCSQVGSFVVLDLMSSALTERKTESGSPQIQRFNSWLMPNSRDDIRVFNSPSRTSSGPISGVCDSACQGFKSDLKVNKSFRE